MAREDIGNGEINISEWTHAMGYLLDWEKPKPPDYIKTLTPEQFLGALSVNLAEASAKIHDLPQNMPRSGVRGEDEAEPIELMAEIFKELAACPKDVMNLRLVRSLLRQMNLLNPVEEGIVIPIQRPE